MSSKQTKRLMRAHRIIMGVPMSREQRKAIKAYWNTLSHNERGKVIDDLDFAVRAKQGAIDEFREKLTNTDAGDIK